MGSSTVLENQRISETPISYILGRELVIQEKRNLKNTFSVSGYEHVTSASNQAAT